MNFLLALHQPHWQTVFTIPKETVLQKGRRHGLYHDLTRAAQAIPERFNCYTWGSESIIFYCGSFAHDYLRGGFKTNFQGRVHHYLQNHKRDARTGRVNTNAMVFDNLSAALTYGDILFVFSGSSRFRWQMTRLTLPHFRPTLFLSTPWKRC